MMQVPHDPFLPISILSDDEIHQGIQLQQTLSSMASYANSFRSMLILRNHAIELAAQHRHDMAVDSRVFREWQMIGARDGAMTLYHFKRSFEGSREAIALCPPISEHIDHDSLKKAAAIFDTAFPYCVRMRTAVAHLGDFLKSAKQIDGHSNKNVPGIGHYTVQGSMHDDNFIVTYEGSQYSYPVTEGTLKVLVETMTAWFAAVTSAGEALLESRLPRPAD